MSIPENRNDGIWSLKITVNKVFSFLPFAKFVKPLWLSARMSDWGIFIPVRLTAPQRSGRRIRWLASRYCGPLALLLN